MRKVVRILSALSAGLPFAISDAGAEPLKPTGKWVVDFDATQCVASRNYGTEEKPLFLAIKAPPLLRIYQIAVIRGGGGGEPTQYDVKVAVGGNAPIETTMLEYRAEKRRVHLVNLTAESFTGGGPPEALRIRGRGVPDYEFELTHMQPLLATLRTCVDDLETYWGGVVETPEGRRAARLPVGNLSGVIKPADYPTQAINRMQGGSVGMLLLVNEKGRVADCTLSETSGVAVLDAQACALVKERARFTPAKDDAGQPSRGIFHQRITWRVE